MKKETKKKGWIQKLSSIVGWYSSMVKIVKKIVMKNESRIDPFNKVSRVWEHDTNASEKYMPKDASKRCFLSRF